VRVSQGFWETGELDNLFQGNKGFFSINLREQSMSTINGNFGGQKLGTMEFLNGNKEENGNFKGIK